MDAKHLKELKALREENIRLKRMNADLSLANVMLKNILTNLPAGRKVLRPSV